MILTNARILTFDAGNRVLQSGSIEVRADGTIGKVSAQPRAGVDLGGRLVMPALINGHTHLYSTLARGITVPGKPPANFRQVLSKLWWRLDRALRPDDVYYSALIGLIDSAKSGVATAIDHHSSPSACAGSLDHIARAFQEVGLRGSTCYETSDRNGRADAEAGIGENVRFAESAARNGCVQPAFGLHAAFTLSDRTLHACREANQSLKAPFHIHVAEDQCDAGAVTRLDKAGLLDGRLIAAHCVHVTPREHAILAERGANVIHNPQSNCNNQVGTANLPGLFRRGVLVGLGSDGYSPRMWEEFKTALHVQSKRVPANAYAAAFVNNPAIVKKLWGLDLGRIATGAQADLVVLDYYPPAPIESGNLFGHLLFGIAHAPVHALMVAGRWVVHDGHCVNVDERRIAEKAARLARALWDRF